MAQRHGRDPEPLADVVFHRQRGLREEGARDLAGVGHHPDRVLGRESMLDLGDYAYYFVGGADILRGTWADWKDDDTAAVKKYFKNVLMPASNPYGESQFGATNKGALALNALGLMAIFNDDTETLDRVVYQVRTLAHIGLRSSNDIGRLGDYLRDQGHAHGQLI
jgi:hypothetical protein